MEHYKYKRTGEPTPLYDPGLTESERLELQIQEVAQVILKTNGKGMQDPLYTNGEVPHSSDEVLY